MSSIWALLNKQKGIYHNCSAIMRVNRHRPLGNKEGNNSCVNTGESGYGPIDIKLAAVSLRPLTNQIIGFIR